MVRFLGSPDGLFEVSGHGGRMRPAGTAVCFSLVIINSVDVNKE